MSDYMTDDVYHLAQGPLHLSRKRREEKADKAEKKTGESINRGLGMKKRGIFYYLSKFGHYGIVSVRFLCCCYYT